MTKLSVFVFLLGLAFSFPAFAGPSPLCEELAVFSCAPGSHDDGTGPIMGEAQVRNLLSDYVNHATKKINEQFKKILSQPENAHFRDMSMAAYGLKNAPICNSDLPADKAQCEKILIEEGLTMTLKKMVLSHLMPETWMQRKGNVADLAYVLQSTEFRGVLADVNRMSKSSLVRKEHQEKIEKKVIPEVKRLLLKKLNELEISDEQRRFMANKIKAIPERIDTACPDLVERDKPRSEDILSVLLVPSAHYKPQTNRIKVCGGNILQSQSDFQLVFTLAHEIAHSIDPCNLGSGPTNWRVEYKNTSVPSELDTQYPIKNIIPCLRSEKSVAARNFTTEVEDTEAAKKGNKPLDFCKDQINEAFADWIAAEVLPEYIETHHKLSTTQALNGYGNVRRIHCKIEEKLDKSEIDKKPIETRIKLLSYPANEDRINKIILANPKARAQMGCPEKHSTHIYCNGRSPSAGPESQTPNKSETVPAGSVQ